MMPDLILQFLNVLLKYWQEHHEKLTSIEKKIEQRNHEHWAEQWIDNEEFLKRLGISRKTGQTYRDQRLISYSQVGNKIYYRNKDIEEFLLKHHIKCRDG